MRSSSMETLSTVVTTVSVAAAWRVNTAATELLAADADRGVGDIRWMYRQVGRAVASDLSAAPDIFASSAERHVGEGKPSHSRPAPPSSWLLSIAAPRQ
jgi:hypothetical protein